MHAVSKILQRLQTSGVDGCHVAESENNDRRWIGQTIDYRIDFVRCAKQKGAMDPEDADVSRNLFMLQDMNMPLTDIFGGHFRHGKNSTAAMIAAKRHSDHGLFQQPLAVTLIDLPGVLSVMVYASCLVFVPDEGWAESLFDILRRKARMVGV